jgi:hypothetical protein
MRQARKSARFVRPLLASLVAMWLVACSDSDSPTAPQDVTGTYALVTVNGQPLPFLTFEDEEVTEEVTALTLTLSGNAVCSLLITFRITEKESGASDTVSDTDSCTFEVTGNSLTLTFGPDDVETATISGTTITLVLEGGAFVLVLEKQ